MRHAKWLNLIFLSLVGCSTIKIKDTVWCFDKGKLGADCFNSMSDKEFSLDKYQWDKLRTGQACTGDNPPADGFINIKTALEKFCADSNRCRPDVKKQVEDFSKRSDKAKKK